MRMVDILKEMFRSKDIEHEKLKGVYDSLKREYEDFQSRQRDVVSILHARIAKKERIILQLQKEQAKVKSHGAKHYAKKFVKKYPPTGRIDPNQLQKSDSQ